MNKNIYNKILNVLYILFLLSLIKPFFNSLVAPRSFDTWNISEYLINYQGGFVRRGLLGEILFFFVKHFHINIEWSVKIVSLICFTFVCCFFVRSFQKKGYSLYILPLCFFCGGLIIHYTAWIRKDAMMICFLIAVLWTWCNKKNLSITMKLIVINLLSVFIILTHEVFAIFSLPILFLLLFDFFKSKNTAKYAIFYSLISIFPSIISFIFAIFANGNIQTAQAIWDSWHIISGMNTNEVPLGNAVGAIVWNSTETFWGHLHVNFLSKYQGIYLVFYRCIMFPIIYYISTNLFLVFKNTNNYTYTENHKKILSTILIFQFLVLIPLYTFLSTDSIRVTFYWIASSFSIYLLIPINMLSSTFPLNVVEIVNKMNLALTKILKPSKVSVSILILIVGLPIYAASTDMFHNTMLYRVISIILTICRYGLSILTSIFSL